MTPRLRAILVMSILLIPVFVFLFLKQFGKNEYHLALLNPQSADCPAPVPPDTMHRIPPFSLLSQDGETITQRDFEGKIYITDFFFARCPDICKVMTSELYRVQDHFKNNPDIRILSHTVDPQNDTVAVLKDYAERNRYQKDFWHFVTGDKKTIYELARCAYFLPVQAGDGGKADFIHSDKLILVDKEKRIRGFYSGTNRDDVDKLILEIQVLLQEYKQQ